MGNPMNVKKHLKQLVCPCKDCQKRHEKCHGSCDQYKNWDAEQKKLKAEMWKERKSKHEADERKKTAVRNYIGRKDE